MVIKLKIHKYKCQNSLTYNLKHTFILYMDSYPTYALFHNKLKITLKSRIQNILILNITAHYSLLKHIKNSLQL